MLFIYISLPPRANLLLDDEYNDFVYATPRGEYRGGPGLSLNDYWVSCIDDKRCVPPARDRHGRLAPPWHRRRLDLALS